ncbi:MAG: SUMF1/EgtB/PvdO family nonheme iron enzyme [Bacteroidales bacterium]
MKNSVFIGLIALLALTGCNSKGGGELVGVPKRNKTFEAEPFGMVKVPMGSFVVGQNDEDPSFSLNSQPKTISVDAFWMDETEITNNEYRQFVHWVIDSITRLKLGEQFPDEFLISEDQFQNSIDPPLINWKARIDTRDEEVVNVLEQMYIPQNERFFRRKELDARKLIYEYQDIDYQAAARETRNYQRAVQNSDKSQTVYQDPQLVSDRSKFVKTYRINIYPDTLCWISDFTYSFNDPMAKMYFWHPGFDEYPVVGVTWEQSKAFCIWRTELQNNHLIQNDASNSLVQNYRLPTESEWEYAARGGRNMSMYPWGSPYTRDGKGYFMANFKPFRGDYGNANKGFLTTGPVGTFEANDFGLYDMAGNVAEWTNSAYDEAAYDFTHDLNPNYEYNALPTDPAVLKRKVVRGGSWKDVALFLQCGTRTYEYQDSAKPYIGFRTVRSTLGVGK